MLEARIHWNDSGRLSRSRDCFWLIFIETALKRNKLSLGESVGVGLRGMRDPRVTLRT